MDSADSDTIRSVLQAQVRKIHSQDEQTSLLRREVKELTNRQESLLAAFGTQINHLIDQMQKMQNPPVSAGSSPAAPSGSGSDAASPAPATPSLPLYLSRPECFSGDSGDCRTFLTQCDLHFELQTAAFPSDRSKIAYIISYLTGRAEAWATAEWSWKSPVCRSLLLFSKTFTQIFQQTAPGREAARALVKLRQGKKRVSDYAIEFRTIAAESDWNQPALFDVFLDGLSDTIKDQLPPLDLPAELDLLIALAIKIDKCLYERERGRTRPCGSPPLQRRQQAGSSSFSPWRRTADSTTASPPTTEEPMQLGRTHLTPEESQRRVSEGHCIYCGQLGHFIAFCLLKAAELQPPNISQTSPSLDPEFPDLSRVPVCYNDLKEVFSKTRATSLPPPGL
eukprot:superscaffoldBa00004989_g19750